MSSNTADPTRPTCPSPGTTALSAGGGGSLGTENNGARKARARHAALIVEQTAQLAQQQAQQLTAQTARIDELAAALAEARSLGAVALVTMCSSGHALGVARLLRCPGRCPR